MLIGVVGSAGAALIGLPGIAMAQPPAPPPPPPPPNVNAYAPVKLSEYQVMDNQWYAFKTPDGLTCVMQRNGGYGCSGPIPGAPRGREPCQRRAWRAGVRQCGRRCVRRVVNAKPLPAGSRISYQTVSCGSDGSVTTCSDSRIQSGFVLSPAGSFIINGGRNPLLDRPEGTNPFIN